MGKSAITVLTPVAADRFTDAGYYELGGPDHFWNEWRFRVLMHGITKTGLDPGQPIHGVEIGCGHGVVLGQIERATAWTVDGIELNIQGLEKAAPIRGTLYQYDVLECREEFRERYDFLVLFDVLEHIAPLHAFLSACLFCLKPGGHIFINVPALPDLLCAYDIAADHRCRYTKSLLAGDLSARGLQPLSMHYWGLSLVPLLAVRSLLLMPYKKNPQHAYRRGFAPPHPLVNRLLRGVMMMETALLRQPPLGTSIFAIARKPLSTL